LPTPITKELSLVVVKIAAGAPPFEFPVPVIPIAPDPLVPVVSTPVKVITVIEDTVLRDNVAVTVALLSGVAAKVRQISEVPNCALVLRTSTQVSPAPETPVTVVLVPEEGASVEMKASNSSFPELVEKAAVVTVVLDVAWSFETV
jgi:hypothetical protein